MPAPSTAASPFLNLSNHPVSTWPAEQLRAAQRLGLGQPHDLIGWETIPADDATDTVIERARRVVERARALGARDVFVQGEPVFTTTLVALLQRHDVRCWATTSERVKTERRLPDGSVAGVSTYRFVAWRPYPDLRALFGEANEAGD